MEEPWIMSGGLDNDNVPQEILEQFQMELDRHQAALRLLKEREQEALAAKQRAAQSQMKVEEMMCKYDDMKSKVEFSKQHLLDANLMVERRVRVRRTIDNLLSRAEELKQKQHLQDQSRHSTQIQLINSISQVSGPPAKPDYGKTVLSLQEKLSRTSSMNNSKVPTDEATSESSSVDGSQSGETEAEGDQEQQQPNCAETEAEQDKEDALTSHLSETVMMIEAKCANVREELGQLALSEQYMRTKQAQLFAKRREREAEEAEKKAIQREKQAQDMRQKVEELATLLAARQEKLKATEMILEKKANVVSKVEKILSKKHRRVSSIEKHKTENAADTDNQDNQG